MAHEEQRRLRPFPGVRLEFGRDGLIAAVRERLVPGAGGELAAPIVRTAGLAEPRRIIEAAALRHADLSREIAEHEAALAQVRARLRLAQRVVIRLVMPSRIGRLAEQGQALIAALMRSRAEREAGKVEVQFATDAAAAAAYAALVRAFEDLAATARIWDANAVTADGEPDWVPVAFSVGASDIMVCLEDVLVAPGARGGSLQISPGFVLLHDGAEVAIVAHEDVELSVTPNQYVVDKDALPSDARVIGETWPAEDAEEQQQPQSAPRQVVEYGDLSVVLPTGHRPAWVFSSYAKARVFAEAYEDYRRALAAVAEPDPPRESPPPATLPQEPPLDVRPPERLWIDALAVVLLIFLLSLPLMLFRPASPPPIAAPAAAPPTAAVPPPETKPGPVDARPVVRPPPKPRRAAARSPSPRGPPAESCGLVRRPDGVMMLVPCPD